MLKSALPLPLKKLAVAKLPKLAFPVNRFAVTFAFANVNVSTVSILNGLIFNNDIGHILLYTVFILNRIIIR